MILDNRMMNKIWFLELLIDCVYLLTSIIIGKTECPYYDRQ